MSQQKMPQYVLVYGPPDEPIVYTTLPADGELAAMAAWECEQRLASEQQGVEHHVRITAGDAVPLPVEPSS